MVRADFYLCPRLLLVICFCLATSTLGQNTPNPHWIRDGCGKCHQIVQGQTTPIGEEAITPLCLTCHDGTHAKAEPHPVGRTLEPGVMRIPPWPMVEGTVECQTCHDPRLACKTTGGEPAANANFLRSSGTPFCENCHRPSQTPKLDPHMMLIDGRPNESKCTICHDKPMDNTAMVRTPDRYLRADVVMLCKSCHPHHKDISQAGHILATIPPPMLAYMRARELTGLLGQPGSDLIQQLIDQHAMPTRMVPDGQGRIVCYTCHNPHEEGTFPQGSVLEDRALRLREGHLLTPVRGSQFCRHCHDI
ncbi:MAG TPA: hypothetical protein VG722_07315 [Tepidisphaeraceae bacterium]|nr:hypothetical protein [Tepidisphaeraceae bacterium]